MRPTLGRRSSAPEAATNPVNPHMRRSLTCGASRALSVVGYQLSSSRQRAKRNQPTTDNARQSREELQISAAQIRSVEVRAHHACNDSIFRTFMFNDLDRY